MSALLSIGAAAALVGMHPQTLRDYERHGLLTPHRTPGGTRRYGQAELRRLARIQQLTGEGMNLVGVGRVLALECELQQAYARIADLERRFGLPPSRTERARGTQLVRTSSVSLELVHVPRPPRSPRWRNQGGD